MVWTADAFLQKRYEAGFKAGYTERFLAGYAEGQARFDAKVLKFLEEHPNATAEDVLEFLNQSRRNRRDGKAA